MWCLILRALDGCVVSAQFYHFRSALYAAKVCKQAGIVILGFEYYETEEQRTRGYKHVSE
jgi:hypothetical protein